MFKADVVHTAVLATVVGLLLGTETALMTPDMAQTFHFC